MWKKSRGVQVGPIRLRRGLTRFFCASSIRHSVRIPANETVQSVSCSLVVRWPSGHADYYYSNPFSDNGGTFWVRKRYIDQPSARLSWVLEYVGYAAKNQSMSLSTNNYCISRLVSCFCSEVSTNLQVQVNDSGRQASGGRHSHDDLSERP